MSTMFAIQGLNTVEHDGYVLLRRLVC